MSQSTDSKQTSTFFDKVKEGLGFKSTHDDSTSTPPPWDSQRHIYLIGGGIGNLSAAAFLVRDGGVPGSCITIFENSNVVGGSLDASGDANTGYYARGGRMLTNDHYECTWGLFKTIPSITHPNQTVYDDTMEFNTKHVAHSQARVVDMNRHRVDVTHMGFSIQDRMELLRLMETEESKLGNSPITDHLSPSFFTTNFWYMWATTFAFQPWHSAIEFKRYLNRFILEFARIETLAGVKRTVYNQYDSLVTPLITWLQERGVQFKLNTTVTDMQLTPTATEKLAVTGMDLCIKSQGGSSSTSHMDVKPEDLVFFTNASMTDASSFGTMNAAPSRLTKVQSGGWSLWEKLVSAHPTAGFGNPSVFNSSISESCWESFTITLSTSKHSSFFQRMEQFSGNKAGTGGLVTFKDSRWFMSIVLYHQPHFANQPEDIQVFWGYGLHPERVGDFVAKPMSQCSGAEILHELCGHLNFDHDILGQDAMCLPCRMPYITSMFMPRTGEDRPLPVPMKSHNLAFVSQFVEIPLDVVFTVEYSIRVAQTAVYQFLGIKKQIPPIHRHDQMMGVKLQTLMKSFH